MKRLHKIYLGACLGFSSLIGGCIGNSIDTLVTEIRIDELEPKVRMIKERPRSYEPYIEEFKRYGEIKKGYKEIETEVYRGYRYQKEPRKVELTPAEKMDLKKSYEEDKKILDKWDRLNTPSFMARNFKASWSMLFGGLAGLVMGYFIAQEIINPIDPRTSRSIGNDDDYDNASRTAGEHYLGIG